MKRDGHAARPAFALAPQLLSALAMSLALAVAPPDGILQRSAPRDIGDVPAIPAVRAPRLSERNPAPPPFEAPPGSDLARMLEAQGTRGPVSPRAHGRKNAESSRLRT